MISAEEASARSPGVGHRSIHSNQIGWTRATGVCWLMISKTSVPQSDTSSPRMGRSRLLDANQRGRSWRSTCEASAVGFVNTLSV